MKKYFILGLLILFHLFLLVNLRFTAWPEMLSYPYLRNNGYLLYKDMIHPYPPLLTMALSIVYKIFGYKLIVLKLVTWGIILVNDILIFLIVKCLTKNIRYSIFALIFYVAVQPFLDGNMLWFDLAVVPPILLATMFLLIKPLNKNIFFAGLFLGIAALIKQTTGIFLIAGALWLLMQKQEIKKLGYFFLGPAVLCLTLVIRLITEGALMGFINWTIVYPFTYWSKFPGYVQMALTNRQLFILALLLIPVIPVLLNRKFLLFTSYFLLSVVLVYPRFSFFHFQLGLVFLVIIFGLLSKELKVRPGLLVTYYVLLFAVISLPIIKTDWQKETRFWGKADIKLAEIIRQETNPNDKIYLLGPHSGLYVLANRLPPKIWSDNFGWYLEVPGTQEKIIASWGKDPPRYIFTSEPQPGNWYDLGTYRPQKIVDWVDREGITIWKIKN